MGDPCPCRRKHLCDCLDDGTPGEADLAVPLTGDRTDDGCSLGVTLSDGFVDWIQGRLESWVTGLIDNVVKTIYTTAGFCDAVKACGPEPVTSPDLESAPCGDTDGALVPIVDPDGALLGWCYDGQKIPVPGGSTMATNISASLCAAAADRGIVLDSSGMVDLAASGIPALASASGAYQIGGTQDDWVVRLFAWYADAGVKMTMPNLGVVDVYAGGMTAHPHVVAVDDGDGETTVLWDGDAQTWRMTQSGSGGGTRDFFVDIPYGFATFPLAC